MTATNENQSKKKPAFYIFVEDINGQNQRVGAAFLHGKGNGMGLVIGQARYSAFPPRAKSEEEEGA